MRRALAAALLAVTGCAGASAQTATPGDGWPTVEHLRGELSGIGWTWTAYGLAWSGSPAGGGPSISLSAEDGWLRVRTWFGDTARWELGGRLWPDGPAWTAFREVAVRLPVPDAVQMEVAAVAAAKDDDCRDLVIPGGMVTAERHGGTSVWIDEGGVARCPGLMALRAEQAAAASLAPGAYPSPAA